MWFHRLLFVVTTILAILFIGILSIQNFSDGPIGPIPGAEFTTGVEQGGLTDWPTIIGFNDQVELQLVSTQSSRIVGAMVHANSLYIPCDLGYIWNRFPPSIARWLLQGIYFFKDWHEHASIDGNVIIRKNGMLYSGELVRVTDKAELDALRNTVIDGLGQMDLPVAELRALPTTGPNDIWFFRLVAL